MHEEGIPQATPVEICDVRFGCGYIWRKGEYADPVYTPRVNGALARDWIRWFDRLELYRITHKELPSE